MGASADTTWSDSCPHDRKRHSQGLTPGSPKHPAPVESSDKTGCEPADRVVTARHPNHLWHVDLTVVPTSAGRWVPWFPFSVRQVWPFVWHVAFVVDHFSRAVIGFAVFRKEPTAEETVSVKAAAVATAGKAPRHLVTDKGSQFTSKRFRQWCLAKGIRQRFGAVGKYGSIAVIERFIKSVKMECTRRIAIPMGLNDLREELTMYVRWFNQVRPHQTLDGQTPAEIYAARPLPHASRQGHNADLPAVALHVRRFKGRRHLPVIELTQLDHAA